MATASSLSLRDQHTARKRLTSGPALVLYIALLRIVLYLFIAPNYGYFRDELYYLACGEHPAFGYVDQPPLIAWIGWLLQHSIGTSLYALRLVPAVAGALTIMVAGALVREFEGGRRAQVLAAVLTLLAPVNLVMSHLFTMNVFEPLFWSVLALIAARILKTGDQGLWLWFGALTGITLLTKYGVVFFLIAFAAAMLLSPLRKSFASRSIYVGIALATVIALPNFLWQLNRQFPFLQLMANIRRSGRDIWNGPLWFVWQQAQTINPIAVPAVVGALIFFFSRKGARFRVFGWTYVFFFGLMLALHAKNYYLAAVYPMIFAAGAVWLERFADSPRLRWTMPAYGALFAITSALFAPVMIPVLPVETFLRYSKALHLQEPRFENQRQGRLPQILADMFGWERRTQLIAAYWKTLSPEEQARTALFSNNYGDAAAIDFFGPRYGLPKAISPHQNYWFWGPRAYTGESVIVLDEGSPQHLASLCQSITKVADLDEPNARPDELIPSYHCRGLHPDLQHLWPQARHWD